MRTEYLVFISPLTPTHAPTPCPQSMVFLFWQPERTFYLHKLRPTPGGRGTATPGASLEATELQLEFYWSMAILCVHGWSEAGFTLKEQRDTLWPGKPEMLTIWSFRK